MVGTVIGALCIDHGILLHLMKKLSLSSIYRRETDSERRGNWSLGYVLSDRDRIMWYALPQSHDNSALSLLNSFLEQSLGWMGG